mmetsp:Transcript_74420/g.162805  ORF Transcript_74420/g.162805 Transcript_74420/m.162805 type:complete len:87 (+) Transcript_74420:2121-2381(+)
MRECVNLFTKGAKLQRKGYISKRESIYNLTSSENPPNKESKVEKERLSKLSLMVKARLLNSRAATTKGQQVSSCGNGGSYRRKAPA